MISAALALAVHFHAPDDIVFKRIYTAKIGTTYTVTMDLPGGSGALTANIDTTVQSVEAEGATVHFKATSIGMPGFPTTDTLPDLVTKVGPLGLPNKATIKSGQEFFVFLGLASITTGTTVKVGDTVTAHWQNDPKDCTIDGTGKIAKFDAAAKLLTVDWKVDMKPSYTVGSTFVLHSVYSTTDFSLNKADGTVEIGGSSMKLKFERKTKN
jgi:hypothetical protein